MHVRGLIVVLLGVLSSLSAHGVDCQKLNEAWKSHFHRDFRVEWKLGPFSCEGNDRSYQLAEALQFLYSTDSENRFYHTARALIQKTRLGTCGDRIVAQMEEGELTLCPLFFELSVSRRAATLIHEAAHGRKDDPGHVICAQGDAKEKPECDLEFTGSYDGGAYQWEVIYVAYVKRHAKSESTRWELHEHVQFLLENRFNRITSDLKKKWSR